MEAGSIQEVTERLKSWCTLHDRGLVRVEWDSVYARQAVVDQLKESLSGSGIPLVEIELPPGEAGDETAARLIEKLRSRSGSAVSITGVEWAFPERGSRLETLAALSFQRETLASLPVRQIWWIPSARTEQFVLSVPDLDSWFRLRLHLTESPPAVDGFQALEETGRKTVSVEEARSVARRFWERLESARAQNVSEDRIWAELAQPALDALLSAGLEMEAEAILATVSTLREPLERRLLELRATRGPEDPDLLSIATRLARLLTIQGDFAGARRIQESALEGTTRVSGEEHPNTLVAMVNLAATAFQQGDYAEAQRLGERVSEVMRRVLGEEHPNTLTLIGNLALTLSEQGDHAGARRLQERALEIMGRVLGQEHPDTLRLMNNLATTLRRQGDLEGARRFRSGCWRQGSACWARSTLTRLCRWVSWPRHSQSRAITRELGGFRNECL